MAISTLELHKRLIAQFSLVYTSPTACWRWRSSNLARRLRKFEESNLIERANGPRVKNQKVVYWRWKEPKAPKIAQLRAQSAALASQEASNA
jgi:hypothetical protein